jgi:tetratricopeptide (TPR) repeat protein
MLLLTISLLLMQAPAVQMPELRPPTRDAAPNTPAEVATLRAGDALYEQGKLDEAIARYEEVFKANPDNVYAINQLADSYLLKKDFQKSIDMAAKGVEFRSNMLPSLYGTIGNTLDVIGQPQKAVEAYRKGLAVAPNSGSLYYNLGVTFQSSLKDPIQARTVFKQGAVADPNHSGIQMQLAVSFFMDDLKTPALLAMSRYLVLDGAKPVAAMRYGLWRQLLNGNAQPPDSNGQIRILVNPNQKKDEGNLQVLDMDIGMSKALAFKNSAGKAAMQSLFEQVDSLFSVYAKRSPENDKDKFLWTYYMPYVTEMQQKGFVEPFVYYASQRANIPGVGEWLSANKDRVTAFLEWSKNYSWPKP